MADSVADASAMPPPVPAPPTMPAPAPNPLLALHQQANAELQAYADLEVVTTFGHPQAEYSLTRKSAGLFDAAHRGILELTGRDRLDFLNRFLTNQTFDKEKKIDLADGAGVYAFLLNNKGRIVTDMNVIARPGATLLELDGRLIQPLMEIFEKYRFGEKVVFHNRRGDLHEIALHGPAAAEILRQAAEGSSPAENFDASALAPLGSATTRVFGVDATIWRDDATGAPGFWLITSAEEAAALWTAALEKFAGNLGATPGQAIATASGEIAKRQLRPIGWAVFNTLRIEAGRPLFGIDFDDSVLPAETGLLDRAVSFIKGCYLGQEIVARMHARGVVARKIVGFQMGSDALPIAGTHLFDDAANQVGAVTSSTMSPILSNKAIGLALVKANFAAPGTALVVPAEGAMHTATIVPLPFYPPADPTRK